WNLEIDIKKYSPDHPPSVKVSDSGMVLVHPKYNYRTAEKIIVLNGKQKGVLPELFCQGIALIGKRILGFCREITSDCLFFCEWDHKGSIISRFFLDSINSINIRQTAKSLRVHDKNYWV